MKTTMDLNKYYLAWKDGAKAKVIARTMNEDGLCLHAYGRTVESYHLYQCGELLPGEGWKELSIKGDMVSKIMALV